MANTEKLYKSRILTSALVEAMQDPDRLALAVKRDFLALTEYIYSFDAGVSQCLVFLF